MSSDLRFFLVNSVVLWLPSRSVRLFFLRRILSSFGKESSVLRNVEIRSWKNVSIGNNSVINKRVLLDGRGGILFIGNNVDIAQETNIWTLGHDPHSDTHEAIGGNVIIEDYVWIASRVTILPNVRIGKGAVVASGSVVTKDVPSMCIVAGVPARVIGKRKSRLLYKLKYFPRFR